MPTITFENEEEFAATFCFLHFGSTLAANLYRDRTLADIAREATLATLLSAISVEDVQITPAGTRLRQLTSAPASIEVDADTLKLVERYVRYGAEKCAPDWVRAAFVAVTVVLRAHGSEDLQ